MIEKTISDNIKSLRKARKLTLQQVADSTGLNKGYLSKIERGLKFPPFSTINQIAAALGVDVAFLLQERPTKDADSRICLTKKDQGDVAQTGNRAKGYRFEALSTDKPGKNMIPYIIEVSPQEEQTFQHEGEEFLYVLEGRMEFTFDDKIYILDQGDSVYFESTVPHSGKSLSQGKTRLLAVIYNYKRF